MPEPADELDDVVTQEWIERTLGHSFLPPDGRDGPNQWETVTLSVMFSCPRIKTTLAKRHIAIGSLSKREFLAIIGYFSDRHRL
jgi:hypothetical protein